MQQLEVYQEYAEHPFISPDRDIQQWLEIGTEKLVPKSNMIRAK